MLRKCLPQFDFSVNHFGRNGSRKSVSTIVSMIVAIVLLTGISGGCQTMRSFRSHSIEKVTSARKWARDGFTAVKQGHLAKAKACFSNARRDLPEDHRLTVNLARTEFEQGNFESAVANMEQALSRSNDPALHAEVGEMYLTMGQEAAAELHVNMALQQNHRQADAWVLKGKLSASKGDQRAALKHFQRALGLEGQNLEAQLLVARTNMALGRPIQALSATETLLAQYAPGKQPDEVWLAKAEALVAMNQTSSAIDVLEFASKRPEASKSVFLQLGQIQLLANEQQKARQTLLRGQKVFPLDPVFPQLLANLDPSVPQRQQPTSQQRVAAMPVVLDTTK